MTTKQAGTESTYTPPDVVLPAGYEWAGEFRQVRRGDHYWDDTCGIGEVLFAHFDDYPATHPRHIVRRTLPTDAEIDRMYDDRPVPERMQADLNRPLTKTDQLRILAGIHHENTQLASELVELADEMDADADLAPKMAERNHEDALYWEKQARMLRSQRDKAERERDEALEALKRAVSHADSGDDYDWIGAAESAIARATGALHATP